MNKDSKFIQITTPCSPMYAENSHRSELVNQLLYNEIARVLEENEDWIKVQSGIDKYVGWILSSQAKTVDHKGYMKVQGFRNIKRKHDFLIPFGAFIEGEAEAGSIDQVIKKGFTFLNAPYLWGGKTLFGIDCSGLMQVLLRVCGVSLPRDASQQVLVGNLVEFSDRQKGDLAFFKNKAGVVTHVGLLISKESILHASGTVRIDQFNKDGIWNESSRKLTHTFHSIKRVIS
ncbi:MAG: NlpC/P60 family protein [Flavobacteriales bacterium]